MILDSTVTMTYRGRTFTIRAAPLGPDWTTDAYTAAITELMPDGTTAEWDTDAPYSGQPDLGFAGTLANAAKEIVETVDEDAEAADDLFPDPAPGVCPRCDNTGRAPIRLGDGRYEWGPCPLCTPVADQLEG